MPAPPTLDRIEVKSIPLVDAAEAAVAATAPELNILKICPVISPPTMPAIELPTGPRFNFFKRAAAMFPPTPPLMS
jgi:hypothetical protein